jgi:hypothetical protein
MDMRTWIAFGLLLIAGCQMDTTPEEKRWSALSGETVYVVHGYSEIVHGNSACPDVQNAKGEVKKYTVKSGRMVDEQGLYAGSPREKLPLCNKCVK